jgi:hypothetical protein
LISRSFHPDFKSDEDWLKEIQKRVRVRSDATEEEIVEAAREDWKRRGLTE